MKIDNEVPMTQFCDQMNMTQRGEQIDRLSGFNLGRLER